MNATRGHSKPVEVAILTAEAIGLITGTPVIDRAKDGREVLLRGPLMSNGNTPAEQRGQAENLMVIRLSARDLLTIAQGTPVDVGPGWTRGGPARVRLATRIEAMVFNRQARARMTGPPWYQREDNMPPPLDANKARELVEPIDLDSKQIAQLIDRFDPFHFG